MSGRIASRFLVLHALLSAFILFASAGSAAAQDALAKLRAEYAAQTNPVDKAKTLAKLAPREMAAVHDFSKAGDDEKALAAVEQYRDAIVATTRALIATGVDASRHSGGFRELQISLRMFIRRLDDLILSLQPDERPSFRAVRADLEMAQNSLIDALSPRLIPSGPQAQVRSEVPMRVRILNLCPLILAVATLLVSPAGAQSQKDYISSTEAAKVRESVDPNERIHLFLSFASDRLKQLQYELDHPSNTVRRAERLNGLLNSFSGCLDEAVDRMELSVEKQEDVRDGIKAVQTQATDFLTYLKNLSVKGPERSTYKDNLEDAIASAEDAVRSASNSAKDNAPAPPVRRPQ